MTIMGEAGVGKTTLMRELWKQLEEEAPAVRRLTGRCLAYGRGITYWPLGEILRQHLGLLEGELPGDGAGAARRSPDPGADARPRCRR